MPAKECFVEHCAAPVDPHLQEMIQGYTNEAIVFLHVSIIDMCIYRV